MQFAAWNVTLAPPLIVTPVASSALASEKLGFPEMIF